MTGRKEYISKDAALRFCVEVLESDTVYSSDVRDAFRAYKSYLEELKTIETTACVECAYAMKKETPVKTIRYECMFDKCWRDEQGNCERGRCLERKDDGKTVD